MVEVLHSFAALMVATGTSVVAVVLDNAVMVLVDTEVVVGRTLVDLVDLLGKTVLMMVDKTMVVVVAVESVEAVFVVSKVVQ